MRKYTINLLSIQFYIDYPFFKFPEIEFKQNRPFLVLVIKIDNHQFAIPFRTNIRHKYCYKFKSTNRQTNSFTALDFTKAILVDNQKYVGANARIDSKEYKELITKDYFIITKFKTFYQNYKNAMENPLKDPEMYKTFKKYCTLYYFNKELKINDKGS